MIPFPNLRGEGGSEGGRGGGPETSRITTNGGGRGSWTKGILSEVERGTRNEDPLRAHFRSRGSSSLPRIHRSSHLRNEAVHVHDPDPSRLAHTFLRPPRTVVGLPSFDGHPLVDPASLRSGLSPPLPLPSGWIEGRLRENQGEGGRSPRRDSWQGKDRTWQDHHRRRETRDGSKPEPCASPGSEIHRCTCNTRQT